MGELTLKTRLGVLPLACMATADADQPSLQSESIADASSHGGVSALNGQLFVSAPLLIASPQRGRKLNFTLTANSVPWSVNYLKSSHSPAGMDCLPSRNTLKQVTGNSDGSDLPKFGIDSQHESKGVA